MNQDKKEKVQVVVDQTGEGLEIQQGIVGVDINMVQENVSVEVNHKTWLSISFSGVYNCFSGIVVCCSNICTKKTAAVQKPITEQPTIEIEAPKTETITERS